MKPSYPPPAKPRFGARPSAPSRSSFSSDGAPSDSRRAPGSIPGRAPVRSSDPRVPIPSRGSDPRMPIPSRGSDPRMPMPALPSDPRLPTPPSEPRMPRALDARKSSEPRLLGETRHNTPESRHMKVASAPRAAPLPFLVRGEVPNEPVLVSIITASQDALEYTHAFVANYCRHRFRVAVAEALTVAAHELLENAINYGSVSGQVLFEIVERSGSAAIRVTNDTIPARIEMLRAHIEKLSTNPELVIMEEMKRSMGSSRTRPMLGLARVVQVGLDASSAATPLPFPCPEERTCVVPLAGN